MFENNPVTKLLKIKYPIIQGGMAWVADADLAAAVSNGGGLGIIAAANMPPELLERQIIKIRTLTDKPFGRRRRYRRGHRSRRAYRRDHDDEPRPADR